MPTDVGAELRRAAALVLLAAMLVSAAPLGGPSFAFPQKQTGTKNMTVFLHYAASAQDVGGVSSNYLADTSAVFQNVKNHDVKAVGQPKLLLDFYLFPTLAGGVHLSGIWQVIVFANSTALHPATWGLEFWEKTPAGSVVWDSGALSPSVLGGPSANNGYVDSPIYGYTLSVSNLDHQFAQGNTLEVEITVNTGATVPLSLWYDSAQQPSRMVLPSEDYMRISGISTSDANGTLRTVFFTFWSAAQRNVTIRTLITDPFGGYDVNQTLVSVEDPAGNWVVSNSSMRKVAGSEFTFNNSYSYSLAYAAGAPQGNYTVFVMALDNNAANQFSHAGTYSPYADMMSTKYSIGVQYPVHVNVVDTHNVPLNGARVAFYSGGVPYATGLTDSRGKYNVTLFTGEFVARVWWEGISVLSQNVTIRGSASLNLAAAVYYPAFRFVDDVNNSLSGVLVFFHFPNGSSSLLPSTSDNLGVVSLTQQPAGNYTTLVLFEGVEVADATVRVASDGPYQVSTMVFQLRVTVVDGSGAPLNGSSVLVSSPGKANGGPYGYLLTDKSGKANFSIPVGSYVVTAEYHGVYLLSPFSNRTSADLTLNHDSTLVVKMSNLPPPVWLTLGFQIIVAAIFLLAAIASFILFRRRRRAAKPLAGQ